MFKIPDWEEDVPKSEMNFSKKTKKKNKATNLMALQSNFNDNVIMKGSVKKQNSFVNDNSSDNNKINKKVVNTKVNVIANKTKEIRDHIEDNNKKGHNFVAKKLETPLNGALENNVPKNKLKKKLKRLNNTKTRGVNINGNDDGLNNEQCNDEIVEKEAVLKLKKIIKDVHSNIHQSEQQKQSYIKKKNNASKSFNGRIKEQNLGTAELNKEVVTVNRQKPNEQFKKNDTENNLHAATKKNVTMSYKKKVIAKMLQNSTETYRRPIQPSVNKLRERMLEKLNAAKFRFLNEKLYTSSGVEAEQLFQSDPAAFDVYHHGYQQQLKKWPVNPLDIIIKKILKMPKSHKIADMGCGQAELAKRVPQTVSSFDLVASAPGVRACNMAHTPLLADSMDVAVYCLALMGKDLTQYLIEANRILKQGGLLLIAEVQSRFEDVDAFLGDVQKLGFKLKNMDKNEDVFIFFEFSKMTSPPVKKSKLPTITLKPCLYKKR